MAAIPAGEQPIQMILVEIAYAARDINLLRFERPDGGTLPEAQPGAHIGLFLPDGNERQYSLVQSGPAPNAYLVAVKREGAGKGGSRYIHDTLKVGTVLPVAPPRNNFPLIEDARKTHLFAGGIGITPIWCMAQRLEALGRAWSLDYACRSREDAAFLRQLDGRANVNLHFDIECGTILPIASLVEQLDADAHLYCCGPIPMLKAFESASAGRPSEFVHVEYFTAKHEAATAGGFEVELARSGRTFVIPEGQTILHVLRAGGVEVPSSCEAGVCGACETRVIRGQPDHRDAILSEAERKASETMMICCSGCLGDRLVLDL